MTVGFDAQIIGHSNAGIGQYAAALQSWLPKVDAATTYRFLRPDRPSDLNMPGRLWWDQVEFPRRAAAAQCDVLLKPGFSVPVRSSRPTVVVLHDLAARQFPDHLHRPSAWFYGRWLPWTLRFARRIIATSSFTASQAERLLRLPAEQMTVVYQGTDPLAHPEATADDRLTAKRLGLPERFVLHVGTIEPRKNLPFLIRVFAAVRKSAPDVGLVLAGRDGWKSHDVRDQVRRDHLESSVRFLGDVSDQDRRSLYRLATGLAFPTRYEGFGRPPLEAMSSGTPVVVARTSSLPEVVGDAGLLVAVNDLAGWVAALNAILTDRRLADDLRQRGLRRASQFTWARAAEQVAAVCREAVDD